MKLIVTFADEDSFSFRDDTICIRISDVKNLLNIINSAELREEFVLTNKVLLDAGYDELIEKEIYEVEKMPYFKNFNSFNSIRICINRDVDFNELYGFLKGFPYQVVIDTDDVDLTLVYKLCSLDYVVEPLIKNIYNTDIITASEMRESLNVVLGFAGKLNDRKLSDLEKLIFLYDYLKTRIYKEDEDYSKSASLSKVTLGESIVCLGYANLFSAVANLIGIPTDVKIYENVLERHNGHASAISYVNDDKYNFHGVLEFDPTWDSKKDKKDMRFVSNYYWFGLSPVYSEECKKRNNLAPLNARESGRRLFWYFNNCYELIDIGNIANDQFRQRVFGRLFEVLTAEFEKVGYEEGLTIIERIRSKDSIVKNDIELLEQTYLSIFENNLGYDEFLRLLYFVRRSEYVFNDDYKLDFEDVVRVARRRETRTNLIAYILFKDRDEYRNVTSLREFKTIPKGTKDKLLYDKERLELVKTLRRINEGRNK